MSTVNFKSVKSIQDARKCKNITKFPKILVFWNQKCPQDRKVLPKTGLQPSKNENLKKMLELENISKMFRMCENVIICEIGEYVKKENMSKVFEISKNVKKMSKFLKIEGFLKLKLPKIPENDRNTKKHPETAK